jgi:methylglutaconyl-CoA hydratase
VTSNRELQEPLHVMREEQSVVRLVLNRARRGNSLNRELVERLGDALRQVGADPTVKLIVIEAEGKAFCAGVDLAWMRSAGRADPADNIAAAALLANLFVCMRNSPIPILGIVQGAVVGAGVGIAACCDIVIASTAASFRLPEVRLGIVPAVISPFLLAKIGESACRRYFLTAETMSATQAQHCGLVHEVCEPEELAGEATQVISAVLLGQPEASRAAKALIRDIAPLRVDAALTDELARRLAHLRQMPAAQAALSAVLDGRPGPVVDKK